MPHSIASHDITVPVHAFKHMAGHLPDSRKSSLLNDVYNEKILELAANIPRCERLSAPDATASAYSKLCGSTVTVDLSMAEGVVTDFGQTVKACLLGQSACSVMARNVVGSTPDELREVGAAMRRMLKDDGPPPHGKWADLAVLQSVKDFRARHASVLLVFDAVEDALAQIERGEAAMNKVAS